MARRSIHLAIVLSSVLTATAAGAQSEERTPTQQAEPLVLGTTATYDPGTIIPRITVRDTKGYARLHRPRTQFVTEMLKTVDAI
jgi:hypothetical protein